jgi:hypothetical protein
MRAYDTNSVFTRATALKAGHFTCSEDFLTIVRLITNLWNLCGWLVIRSFCWKRKPRIKLWDGIVREKEWFMMCKRKQELRCSSILNLTRYVIISTRCGSTGSSVLLEQWNIQKPLANSSQSIIQSSHAFWSARVPTSVMAPLNMQRRFCNSYMLWPQWLECKISVGNCCIWDETSYTLLGVHLRFG